MLFRSKHLKVIGYSNSNFSGNTNDRKCTSGYVFLLGGGAISWCNKKQSCVAKSTMEAEYIACSSAISEAVWIKGFLKSLNIKEMPDEPIKVMCDNQAAICIIKSGELGTKGKHIERHYYYIFDVVLKNKILVEYASSKEMVADPLTNAAAAESFKGHVRTMGVIE